MAINLRGVASGIPSQSTCNPNLPVTQAIQIVPKSINCQNLQSIEPARTAVGISPRNLIVDSCGQIILDIDNAGEGQTENTFALGGPATFDRQAQWAQLTAYSAWDGFNDAEFLVTIDGLDQTRIAGAAGTAGQNGEGAAIINQFVGRGNALLVSNILYVRADTSVTANNTFANTGFKTFLTDNSTNYAIEYGATVYADVTSTGSGSTSDFQWCFGPGGVPITGYTGVEITVPAEFDGQIRLCIDSVEGAAFEEGC